MRDILNDLIRHTDGLGFLDTVRVDGDENRTNFDSIDNDRTIIMKATTLKPSDELKGSYGISRFNILKGYLKFTGYRTEEATLKMKHRTTGNKDPEELIFSDGNGQTSVYRFMNADLLAPVSNFKGKEWDVSFVPDKSKISEFSQLASILSGTEKFFAVKTTKNEDGSHDLKFVIGDESSTTDHTVVTMVKNVGGELKGELLWPIQQILVLLNLGLDENLSVDIMSRGALRISMTSPHTSYEYFLPARKK